MAECDGEAQSIGLTTSATNVIGFGETLQQRISHLERLEICRTRLLPRDILDLHLSSHGLSNWKITRSVKGIGVLIERRWVLERWSIFGIWQYPIVLGQYTTYPGVWPTMGLEVAQLGLSAGADDIGSTMMEENVVSASGTTRTSVDEHELRRIITTAGYLPKREILITILSKRANLLSDPNLSLQIGHILVSKFSRPCVER